ncbi:GtrA family protein [Fusobacterium pseudoperiodonticum]|uniref:GtrA family protein n=1 Tax=Fusobacterium pseudoperiodonticum TaxID=2663009 RepID=UPI0028E32923|nr:GtrA family protein [Fusobacterium pseudoperiodonticum]
MKNNNELIKFLMVGVLNTIIGASIMFAAYNLMGLNYWISTSLNYIVAGTFSFFANKKFTFKSEGKTFQKIILFIITLVFCYFIAFYLSKKIMIFININNIKLKENVSMVLGMIIYTALNFILQKKVVFRKEGE